MRLHRICLFAFLAAGGLASGLLPPAAAIAQGTTAAVEPGLLARVAVRPTSRVNVRSEPTVAADNIVGKAQGGEAVSVLERRELEPYPWYRVRARDERYEGWIRGDLIEEMPSPAIGALPSGEAGGSAAPQVLEQPQIPVTGTDLVALPEDQGADRGADRLPLDQRNDWSRHLYTLYPAMLSCMQISSAQPTEVLRAYPMSRELAEIVIRDDAGRRWDCIIRDRGGTPVRFDPLGGSMLRVRSESEPVFTPEHAGEPDDACLSSERVMDPSGQQLLGWLSYPSCS